MSYNKRPNTYTRSRSEMWAQIWAGCDMMDEIDEMDQNLTAFYRVHSKNDQFAGMYMMGGTATAYMSSGCFELDSRHPAPRIDSKLVKEAKDKYDLTPTIMSSAGYYGFTSLDQFRRWVYNDAWLCDMDADNLVISKYMLPDVICGNTQAIALRFVDAVPVKTVAVSAYKQLDED